MACSPDATSWHQAFLPKYFLITHSSHARGILCGNRFNLAMYPLKLKMKEAKL